MHDPEALTRLFRAEGLKVTPQRRAIFELLHARPGHHAASSVYEHVRTAMSTISLKTVYETLHSLVALGQIQRLDLGTGQIVFDCATGAHHHLVCTRCGRAEDLELDVPEVPAGDRRGFVVHQTEVVVRGVCPTCAGAPD